MCLNIFIVANIILFFIVLLIDKNDFNPAYLFLISWTTAAISLPYSEFSYDPASEAYLYLAAGSIVFVLGVFFGSSELNRHQRRKVHVTNHLHPNYRVLMILQILQVLALLYCLSYIARRTGSDYGDNIVQAYFNSKESETSTIPGYLTNINSSICLVLILCYRWLSKNERKRYKRIVVIEIAIYIGLILARFTRNNVMIAGIPLLFTYYIAKDLEKRKRIKITLFFVLLFVIYFSIYGRLKYWYLYADRTFFDVSKNQFSGYLSGALVAFQKVFDTSSFPNAGGGNTFRFFIAIADRLQGVNTARELIQQFTTIGGTYFGVTNVYTFYYWYVCDFGLGYALLMQFLVGLLHGKLYREYKERSLFGTFVYCQMLGPLIMQFFQDEYFSLFSGWVQNILAGAFTIFIFRLLSNDAAKQYQNSEHRIE